MLFDPTTTNVVLDDDDQPLTTVEIDWDSGQEHSSSSRAMTTATTITTTNHNTSGSQQAPTTSRLSTTTTTTTTTTATTTTDPNNSSTSSTFSFHSPFDVSNESPTTTDMIVLLGNNSTGCDESTSSLCIEDNPSSPSTTSDGNLCVTLSSVLSSLDKDEDSVFKVDHHHHHDSVVDDDDDDDGLSLEDFLGCLVQERIEFTGIHNDDDDDDDCSDDNSMDSLEFYRSKGSLSLVSRESRDDKGVI